MRLHINTSYQSHCGVVISTFPAPFQGWQSVCEVYTITSKSFLQYLLVPRLLYYKERRWVRSYGYYICNTCTIEFHGTFVFKACTTLSCCLLMLVIVASDVCWALVSCCSSRFTSSLAASRLFLVDTNWDCRQIMDIYNTMTP